MVAIDDAVTLVGNEWEVPAGWHQGRGAWGGLVAAAIIRAAGAADGQEPGLRPLREAAIHMVGPLPAGPVQVRPTLVRRGSATAAWRVDIVGEQTWAIGSVVFGASRADDFRPVTEPGTPPVAPSWTEMEALTVGPPVAPEFLQHFAVRLVSGLPYSGTDADVLAWIMPAQPPATYDDALLVGLVDAMWPATLVQVAAPRPMATLSFSATLLVDPATVNPAEPLLHRGRMLSHAQGYVTESRELWTPDGRLAVHNTQVVAVIR